jgi:hypothetical protein
MKRRSSAIAKCIAYGAALFAFAAAWPRVLDVSPPLPRVPGLPAVESVVSAVIEGKPSDSEPPNTRRSRAPAEVAATPGPDTDVAAIDTSDLGGAPEAPAPPSPRHFKPVYPSGYVAGGEVAVDVPAADGSIATVLERQLATLTEGECRDFRPWTEVEPVNVIPDGTCARYRTVVGEEPGEQAVSVADNVVRRDDTPPAPPKLAIIETSESAHAVGDTLFYRPGEAEAGTFVVAAAAADPQSGVGEVTFPALGDTAPTTQSGPDARVSYPWGGSVGGPTEGVVVATNGAGAESEAPLKIVDDVDPPAGGSISYAGGLHRDGTVEVNATPGEDAASGVDRDSGVLEAQDARLAGGRCRGDWSPWHTSSPDGSPGQAACVRFRYRVSDNVGNEVTYESSVVTQVVDQIDPTVALIAPSDGATVSGTVTVSAEADDLGFGVADVRLQFSRAARCHARWQTIASVTATPYGAAWDTQSLAPGTYRLRAVVTDRAGNSSVSQAVTVQVAEPVAPEPPAEDDDDGTDAEATVSGDGDDDPDADEASPGQTETEGAAEATGTQAGEEEAPAETEEQQAEGEAAAEQPESESGDGGVTRP